MDASSIIFLGAGKCNVVVDLPMSYVSGADGAAAPQHRAALRIRYAAHKECPECYRALERYAGGRRVVPLPAALYAAIASVVPAKFHYLMQDATEATLVPNFTSDPAQLLQLDVAACDAPGRVADYTVEVKPKSVWQPPQVLGIHVDGTTHWIEPAKHRNCRYAQMLRFKEVRDAADEAPASVASDSQSDGSAAYCPNYLFRPTLSSREGLQRLMHSPQNNLKVISYHPSRADNHPGRAKTLTVAELNGIADAVDASKVLAPLAHLQLCGCAPPNAAASAAEAQSCSVPVLDADLLYHWSLAADKAAVQWMVVDPDPAGLCRCVAGDDETSTAAAAPRAVPPMLDYDTCLERFYVSTTAKDVSLMIAVSCRGKEPEVSSCPYTVLSGVAPEVGGGCFVRHGADVYRVGVVDLDAKTHKTLAHYYKHDKDIVSAFVAHHGSS